MFLDKFFNSKNHSSAEENGGVINLGAYGGTSQASKSYFDSLVCETIVAGDINGDCRVDQVDMDLLLIHWMEEFDIPGQVVDPCSRSRR